MNGSDLAVELNPLRPGPKCWFMSGYNTDVVSHRGVLEDGVGSIALDSRTIAGKTGGLTAVAGPRSGVCGWQIAWTPRLGYSVPTGREGGPAPKP